MLDAFGCSDQGCVRGNNEDYFISDKQAGIFILADGMGGASAGEYASRLSVEVLYKYLRQSPPLDNPEALKIGFAEANRAVRHAADSDAALGGMGTTLIAAREIGESRIQVASVGDSRAYLLSADGLQLITRDQTWVEEVGTRLGLSEEALRKHPMRHVLTMAVGSTEEIRLDYHCVRMARGDQMLLCSDGLHGVIGNNILEETLNSEKSLAEKCHYLVEAAKTEGGPDNITVVLIRKV